MHLIPMKIVLLNHTKSNKTKKYNGIYINIVYYYNIMVFVIIIIIINITMTIINSITLNTHISIHEFAINLNLCKYYVQICIDFPQLA